MDDQPPDNPPPPPDTSGADPDTKENDSEGGGLAAFNIDGPAYDRGPLPHHTLEARAEKLTVVAGGPSFRTGVFDRIETGGGTSSDNVNGTETLYLHGSLMETTAQTHLLSATNYSRTINGKLTMYCSQNNIIAAGTLVETHIGGELLLAGMSDDMIGGGGLRATMPHRYLGRRAARDGKKSQAPPMPTYC